MGRWTASPAAMAIGYLSRACWPSLLTPSRTPDGGPPTGTSAAVTCVSLNQVTTHVMRPDPSLEATGARPQAGKRGVDGMPRGAAWPLKPSLSFFTFGLLVMNEHFGFQTHP